MISNVDEFVENFDLTENALDMRSLIRWNGRDLRKSENLSEHTHLVLACAINLYDEFKGRLIVDVNFEDVIRLAAIHDSLEILHGDILSVTKDAIPDLRRQIDNEEFFFSLKILKKRVADVVFDLVKLADTKACFKFIERELRYPSNDFAYYAYNHTKNVFDKNYKNFVEKYVKQQEEPEQVQIDRFSKGYKDDAGTDIILDKKVQFLPHSTTIVDLNVKVIPKAGEMATLCARTSAAKQGLNVAMCPVDANFNGTVSAIVHNISNNVITYEKGTSFCQWIGLKLSDIKNVSDEVKIKNKGKRCDGKFGSTGGTNANNR